VACWPARLTGVLVSRTPTTECSRNVIAPSPTPRFRHQAGEFALAWHFTHLAGAERWARNSPSAPPSRFDPAGPAPPARPLQRLCAGALRAIGRGARPRLLASSITPSGPPTALRRNSAPVGFKLLVPPCCWRASGTLLKFGCGQPARPGRRDGAAGWRCPAAARLCSSDVAPPYRCAAGSPAGVPFAQRLGFCWRSHLVLPRRPSVCCSPCWAVSQWRAISLNDGSLALAQPWPDTCGQPLRGAGCAAAAGPCLQVSRSAAPGGLNARFE